MNNKGLNTLYLYYIFLYLLYTFFCLNITKIFEIISANYIKNIISNNFNTS